MQSIIAHRTQGACHLFCRLFFYNLPACCRDGRRSSSQSAFVKKQLDSIPNDEERLLIATGRYISEGFDDSRLDTLFLNYADIMAWHTGTRYRRLHRTHDSKKEVVIYDSTQPSKKSTCN